MAIVQIQGAFYNILESESANTSVFTNTISSSVITFLILRDDLRAFIDNVLGSAKLEVPVPQFNVPVDGYIRRIIPASHPIYPWQYASKIVDIKGYTPLGKEDSLLVKKDTTFKNIDTQSPPFVGIYEIYKVSVLFESAQFNIYRDQDIDKFDIPDVPYSVPRFLPNNVVSEEWLSFNDRAEYLRYTNIEYQNEIELLTFGNGNFYGIGSDAVLKNFAIPINNDLNYTKICKQKIQFKWYMVPFEMSIRNYHWLNCYSRINALPFTNFPVGELLFDSVTVDKYEPYYPFELIDVNALSTVGTWYNQYNKNQYCDITFNFIRFTIPEGRGVRPDVATYKPFGWKDVDSAHNRILYNGDLKWYYFETDTNINKGRSLYYNYPFELLFQYRVEA